MASLNRLILVALLAALAIAAVVPYNRANEIIEEEDFDDDIIDTDYQEGSSYTEEQPGYQGGSFPLPQPGYQLGAPPPYPIGQVPNLTLPYAQPSYGTQQSYQQPIEAYQPPIQSYQPPIQPYQPPVEIYQQPIETYQPPVEVYQPPVQSYQPPVQSYQPPVQSYQPPVQTYQPQAPVSNYSAPVLQQSYVAPPAPAYLAPSVTAYQAPPVQAYQVPVSNYSAPVQQQSYVAPPVQTYQPPVSNYSAPVQQQTYQPPVQTYQPPVQTYQPPVQTYQPPVQTYQPQAPVSNYSAPVQQQSYAAPPVQAYRPPVAVSNYSAPLQKQSSYAPQSYVKQTLTTSYKVPQFYPNGNYTPSVALSKYSGADLGSLVPLTGYLANHWSLLYYRLAPYKLCPKNLYLAGPTSRDIEAAFSYALQQLASARTLNLNYLNATQPSYAARHQVFSLLTNTNARQDEEGLLVELVSIYLADRACLTKWDKQRYLPQLTKFISVSNFPSSHSCNNLYRNQWQGSLKTCVQSKYRTYDGFCNNPYHPYWGKSNVCHIRLLSPDYADGISLPRNSYNSRYPLPNPRVISTTIHSDIPLEGPYNLMKMQWGQFINHDITNTALSSYDGMVDCCKNPHARGCWPIMVQGDKFYTGGHNVTCLNFIRSAVCPTCQLGPRQQLNKNTAFLDASQVYGQSVEQSNQLRTFRGGLLRTSSGKNGEILLPVATDKAKEQCSGICFASGDSRTNQHPALTALHTLMLRNHNIHAYQLALRHPDWNDEYVFQEARRIVIAEYQMITYSEYLPIVFGPILSAYYKLLPLPNSQTYYDPKTDPTTWNEYVTASCRFGHSQIQSNFGLYPKIFAHGELEPKEVSFPLKEWFVRPSFMSDGLMKPILNGLLTKASLAVDPWITTDVSNYLYRSRSEHTGGDLAATNIWRGRDHGIPGYIHYVEFCFNIKVRTWKDLATFIPYYPLSQLRKVYKVVENIDLFTGGLAERHFPGADTGPTFACINGIQYYHLKFGDRFYFEHQGQVGSFNPAQLEEIKRSSLAKLLCRTAYLPNVPQYAFLRPSQFNPLVDCSQLGAFNYNLF